MRFAITPLMTSITPARRARGLRPRSRAVSSAVLRGGRHGRGSSRGLGRRRSFAGGRRRRGRHGTTIGADPGVGGVFARLLEGYPPHLEPLAPRAFVANASLVSRSAVLCAALWLGVWSAIATEAPT